MMGEEATPSPNPSPLDEMRQVDALCVEFCNAVRAGRQPAIEAYLERVPPTLRATQLRELISEERELTAQGGSAVSEIDYRARFPDYASEIEEAFRHLSDVG